jgi:pimeloyl-ACP methyl ester carboxylesterase
MESLEATGVLDIGDARLEYGRWGPTPSVAPTIVLLHEGLGCLGLWGDFPARLAAATGVGAFGYSRAGYGASSPVALPRRLTYMHEEALDILPSVLAVIGFRRGILVGHSDGASIAAIYAGGVQDHRVRGLSLIAPHFFTEDVGIAEIARAKIAYEAGDLKPKLARWQANVDNASAAGMTPGSTLNSANGISANISPISAFPSKSCKARTINMERYARSRLRKPNAIAR